MAWKQKDLTSDLNGLIQAVPITNFTTNSTSSCSGTIIFSDLTSNNPSSWLWDFGDGNTSTQQNPTHTYTTTGTYDVQLISYNNFGSDTVIQNNLVQINLTNTPPSAPSCASNTDFRIWIWYN